MPNFLQKWLYNLSAGAPLLIVFSVVWYCEKKSWIIPGICICAAILLTVLMRIAFVYCRRNLPPITINVTDVAPYDVWIAVYIISYFVPFISMTLDDCNLLLFVAISAAVILVAPFVNSAIPNPFLFSRGYHFYKIGTQNGVSGYVLISKRKIRNAKEIKRVNRVFEFLLKDVEGI